jgi:uncharacterized membrane protein YtjA (UPF0391 family)
MFRWAVVILIVAMAAAVLGFGGLIGIAALIAKGIFLVGLVLFVVLLVLGGRPPWS